MVTESEALCKGKISRKQAELLLLLSTVFWGMSFILVKLSLAHIGPFSFIFWRSLLALPFLGLFRWRTQKTALNRQSILIGIFLGVVLFGVYALQTVGLLLTSAVNASLLTSAYVIFIPILAWPLIGERPYAGTILGVLCCMLGSAALSGGKWSGLMAGDAMVLASAVLIAVHIIAIQSWTKRFDPFLLTTIQIAVLGGFGGMCAVARSEQIFPISLSLNLWIPMLVAALLVTVVCFLVQSTMQRHTTATMSGIIYSTEGFWGALFAWAIGGEIITRSTLAGGALMFAGIFFAQYPFLRAFVFPRAEVSRE